MTGTAKYAGLGVEPERLLPHWTPPPVTNSGGGTPNVEESTLELVVNGGCEVTPLASDFVHSKTPSGWDCTGGFTGVLYAIGGTSDLNLADRDAVSGGIGYFAGGPLTFNLNPVIAQQSIDLTADAAAIDGGTATAVLSAWLGGWGAQNDHMDVDLEFFFEDGSFSETTVLHGPTAADRGNESQLMFKSGTIQIPSGARFVNVILIATRDATQGNYNDGYADNVSLTIVGTNLATGLVTVNQTHDFSADVVGLLGGIHFYSQFDATATFKGAQLAVQPHAHIVGDPLHNDTLIVRAAHLFDASAYTVDHWDQGSDTITIKGTARDDDISGTAVSDTITGGDGEDTMEGAGGADALNGGVGADRFAYGFLNGQPNTESTGNGYDTITRFDFLEDQFQLPTLPAHIDRMVKGTLNAASLDTDLANVVNHLKLAPHDAVLVRPTGGDLTGTIFLVVDCNGTAGYQAEADLVVGLAKPQNLDAFSLADFVT